MLALEPRASDDETLESEASIGTADSSENLNVDSEGTTSDFSGMRLYCVRKENLNEYFTVNRTWRMKYFPNLLGLLHLSSVDE